MRIYACLALAAMGCLVPSAWVAFPAACVLLLWLPGQLLVRRVLGLGGSAGGCWSVIAAAMVLMPVPLSWLWRFSNDRLHVLGVVVAVNLLLLVLRRNPAPAPNGPTMFAARGVRIWLIGLLLYVGACVFGSYWLPGAGERVGTCAARDYVKHHAVVLSLERFPLPLRNFFYAVEADTPYYYYEYHYYVPAALRKLTGDTVSIGLALGFSSAVLAMAFICLVCEAARALLGSAWSGLFAGVCVSVVGGWDIVPVVISILGGDSLVIVLDSWMPIPWRIHNLMTQYLWAPQHMAAVLALLLAGLWLRAAPTARWWLIAAPLLAAAIFGSSVYLAMTFFPAAAAYVFLRMFALRGDARRLSRMVASTFVIALLGLILMGAQARGYYIMGERFPGGLTTEWDRSSVAFLGRLVAPGPLANWLDAPWILMVELGLPAVACLLVARRCWGVLWRDEAGRLWILAGVIGTLALFTFRSSVSPFDYGFRIAIKPLQIVGAICAGALLVDTYVRPRLLRLRTPVLVLGVLLGLPVGLYEAPLMAVRSLLLRDPHRLDAGALRYLHGQTPLDAVVQGDPLAREGLLQQVERQIGVSDPENSHVRVFFPLDPARMRQVFDRVRHAFTTGSAAEAYADLRSAQVTYVLAGQVEHELHGEMLQFEDPACFESVYRDEHARVYRLKLTPGPESAPTSASASPE